MAGARVHTSEFRISVAERMRDGESVSGLSKELKIRRSVLYRWREIFHQEGAEGLKRSKGRPPGGAVRPPMAETKAGTVTATASDRKVAELERRLGQMALENDFLRRAFKRVKEARSKNSAPGEARCTEK